MGHITVLVQHAWAMQPSLNAAGGTGASTTEISMQQPRTSSRTGSQSDSGETNQKKFLALKNKVRVSDPVSIADFIHEYHNTALEKQGPYRKSMEEFVKRLETLLSVCAHPCPLLEKTHSRKTKSEKMKHGDALPSLSDTIVDQKKASSIAGTTRGCRLSLLLIGQTPDAAIQKRSAELLYNYLETNRIHVDMDEFLGLCELLTEMANVVCHVVENDVALDDPKKRMDLGSGNLFMLFKSISLVCERIDLIRDALHIDLSLENKEMVQGFRNTLEKLKSNPSLKRQSDLEEILSLVQLQLSYMVNAFQESEEAMTASIGISFLSSLIRKRGNLIELAKEEVYELLEPYVDIMHDIKDKERYLMGRKFIRIVSTSGSINLDTVGMYLEFVEHVMGIDYVPWMVEAVYSLAIIAIHSRAMVVKRFALTNGLLRYVTHTSPHVRQAAVIGLSEIVSRRGREPDGLMATEVIRQRQQAETDPQVQETLKEAFRKKSISRTSHFYWHGNFFLADSYADSQSEYRNLRKYVKSVDRGTRTIDPSFRNTMGAHCTSRIGAPDSSLLNRTGPFDPQNDAKFIPTDAFRLDQSRVPLQLGSYHRNYKHVSLEPGETLDQLLTRHFTELALEDINKQKHPSDLYPSSRPLNADVRNQISFKSSIDTEIDTRHDMKPAAGSVNSRKLFNAQRPKQQSTRLVSKQPPLKFSKGKTTLTGK